MTLVHLRELSLFESEFIFSSSYSHCKTREEALEVSWNVSHLSYRFQVHYEHLCAAQSVCVSVCSQHNNHICAHMWNVYESVLDWTVKASCSLTATNISMHAVGKKHNSMWNRFTARLLQYYKRHEPSAWTERLLYFSDTCVRLWAVWCTEGKAGECGMI